MKLMLHTDRQSAVLLPTVLTLMLLSAWPEPGIAFAQSHRNSAASSKATLQSGYDRLIQQTGMLLQSGQYAEALEKGCKAVALNKTRSIGHQYCSVAYYRLRLWPQAEREAAQAVHYASAAEQPKALELQGRVTKAHQFADLIKSAEQAADTGLQAKAAAEYTEAWKLFPNQGSTGLHAAILWKDVQNWTECAAVLNHLQQSDLTSEQRQQMNELLQAVAPTFEGLYAQKLEQAFGARQHPEEAAKHLTEASELLPDRFEAYYYLAMLSASATSSDDSIKMLNKAIKTGKLTVEQIMSDDGTRIQDPNVIGKFWECPAFLNLVRNVYGPSAFVLVEIQKTLKIPDLKERINRMAQLQMRYPDDNRIEVTVRRETEKLISFRLQQAQGMTDLSEKLARLTNLQKEYPGDSAIQDAVVQALHAKKADEDQQLLANKLKAEIETKQAEETRSVAELSQLSEDCKTKIANLGDMKRDIPGWRRLQQNELRRADQAKDEAESEEAAAKLARQLNDNIAAIGHDFLANERRKDERGYRNHAEEYENKVNQVSADIDQIQTEIESLRNRLPERKKDLEQVRNDIRDLQQRSEGL